MNNQDEKLDSKISDLQKWLSENHQSYEADVQGVKSRVDGLHGDVQGIKGEVQGIKGDVQGMKTMLDQIIQKLSPE